VQSFLVLVNYYRRFIQDYARVSAPLSELTRKGVPFEWGGGQDNSFQNLKDAVKSAPVLCYGAETLGDKVYVRRETFRLLLLSCTGPLGTLRSFTFNTHFVST
jgi:hypothetical protein